MLVQLIDLLIHQCCIRARRLVHQVEHTRHSVDIGGHRVTLRTDLHSRHIFQIQHLTAFARTEYDILEFLDGFERTFVLHRILIGILGLLTQRTYRRYETLRLDSGRDIVRHETVLRHMIGFHPYTQRVRVSQVTYVTHTCDTEQTRFDVDVDIVGDKIRVVLTVGRFETRDLQDTVLPFGDGDTGLQHIARQQGLRLRHTVLDVDGRHVGIGALLEIHHDRYVTR